MILADIRNSLHQRESADLVFVADLATVFVSKIAYEDALYLMRLPMGSA